MNSLTRALRNRKARRENLNDDGTAYHGTNASSLPEDTRWWRSVPRDATIHVPSQFDFSARIREMVTTYPQAFDDTTGTFLFPWLDAVQETWIAEIERAFNNAVFQEKGLFIEDERRAREAKEEERRLHAAVTLWDKQLRGARDHLLGEHNSTTAWDAQVPVTAEAIKVDVPVPVSLEPAGSSTGPALQLAGEPERNGESSTPPSPRDFTENAAHRLHDAAAAGYIEEDPEQPNRGLKSA